MTEIDGSVYADAAYDKLQAARPARVSVCSRAHPRAPILFSGTEFCGIISLALRGIDVE